MDESFLLVALLTALVCGAAGAALLGAAEKSGTGFWLGFLLGPLGLIIAWAKRDDAMRELEERAQRHRQVDNAMRGLRQPVPSPRPSNGPVAAGGGSGAPSAIEELERLAALREKGHVSEDEFNYRKRQLLGLPLEQPTRQHQPPRLR
ncbi:MAG TPA: SHOCT domain-containing protein [Gemmatimonadaceae bacterium]|jgi:hypothetical protein